MQRIMEVIHVMSVPNQITSYKTTLMQYKLLYILGHSSSSLDMDFTPKTKIVVLFVNKFSEEFDIENNPDVLFFLLLQFRYKMT